VLGGLGTGVLLQLRVSFKIPAENDVGRIQSVVLSGRIQREVEFSASYYP